MMYFVWIGLWFTPARLTFFLHVQRTVNNVPPTELKGACSWLSLYKLVLFMMPILIVFTQHLSQSNQE